MAYGSSDKTWKRFGEIDPYFAIKGGDRLRVENIDSEAIDEFFQSGLDHLDMVFGDIKRHLDQDFAPRSSLDFGCGFGRVLIPLAKTCERAVGVDISPAMLEGAKKYSEQKGFKNVEVLLGDDQLSRVTGSFDLVHAHIVLQHIPPKRGEEIFARLVDLLNPEGIGAIHITYYRDAGRVRKAIDWSRHNLPLVNNLVNILQGESINRPAMQMNCYDLNRLFHLLRIRGCEQAFVHNLEPVSGYYRVMLYFKKGIPD